MKKKLTLFFTTLSFLVAFTASAAKYQLDNSNFEDWSGPAFKGQPTLGGPWHGANISQLGFDFQVVFRSTDSHSGKYSVKCEDTEVGALGIKDVSPSWITLGKPWSYISGISQSSATAGTDGGIAFTARPDSMAVWIKRHSTSDENINLVYYSWKGTSRGDSYLSKGGDCTSTTHYDEESDIRTTTDKNVCGTKVNALQIGEGHFQSSKKFGQWTEIKVPIKYYNDNIPEKMNVILSASNYPEGRRNNGLVKGNYMLVDDFRFIYSSKIHELRLNGEPLNKFKPDTYTYSVSLGDNATDDDIPEIECKRSGRTLTSDEVTINYAKKLDEPTTITVRAEDGSSTTTYTVVFKKTESINSHASAIYVNGNPIPSFSGYITEYNVEVPYGTKETPNIEVQKSEATQEVEVIPCSNFPCVAQVIVRAENRSYSTTYNINLSVGELTDNTLQDIKINGNSIPGFNPNNNTYVVELPLGTTENPTIEAVSKYEKGAQKITITDGGLNGRSSIVVTPPAGTPRTYRISYVIKESSYSYLKDIQLDGVSLDGFTPENTQYDVVLPLGTTKLPVITWTQGDPYQTVTKTDEGVNGTARIRVKAQNNDVTIYRINFSVEKSTVSTLKNILINNQPLVGFYPDVTDYTFNVTGNVTTRPVVSWETADAYQIVTKNPTSESTVSVEGVTKLTVRAQNGNTTVYNITFTQKLSDNANLAGLMVEGYEISPAFSPETTEYTCKLGRGTTKVPNITFTKGDETQDVRIYENGVNGVANVIVKAQTGTTNVYKIAFSVETSSDATLKDILVGGKPIDGFKPEVLKYNLTLPSGTTVLPNIEVVKNDASQRVAINRGPVNGDTQIKVVAEDGTTLTYTLAFSVEKSLNANLKNIYVNGLPLADFNPDVMIYTYILSENMSSCPMVKAEGYPGQTITTTLPKLEGLARINVQPEDGIANVYTIEFVRERSSNNKLKNLMVNGTSFGFQPDVNDYTITLPEGTVTVPTITYSKGNEDQTVQVISAGLNGTTKVIVLAEDLSENVYTIHFEVEKSSNVQLRGIYVDGIILPDFNPEVLSYNYVLPISAESLPKITYLTQEGQQVSMLQPKLEGDVVLVVKSEDLTQTAKYTIHFTKNISSDTTLKAIYLDGELLTGFDSETFEYTLLVQQGSELPVVTYKKQNSSQQVLVKNEGVNGCVITVISHTGTQNTYTIKFNEVVGTEATLADIQLYDAKTQSFVSIDGFKEDTFEYTIKLPFGTKQVPAINPVSASYGQQIKLVEHELGQATSISVVSADGSKQSIYMLHMEVEKSNDATLSNILVGGNDISDFSPLKFDYTISLPYGTTTTPTIDIENAKLDGMPILNQKVEIIDQGLAKGVKINVTSEDETDNRTYNLHFNVEKSTKANVLKAIAVGQTSVTLKEGVFTYDINLPEDVTELPQLTIEKNYAEQEYRVVKYDNKYVITVVSNLSGVKDVVYTINCNYTKSSMVIERVNMKNNSTLYPNFNPYTTEYVAKVKSNEDIEFIYDDDYYQLTFPEKTDKKIVAMLNKIGDKSVNKIYTFYLHTTDISDRLSDVYLYNITGVKEQELPLLAPISKVDFDAKEGLASIGELVLSQKVNGSWREVWREDIGGGWGGGYDSYSAKIDPKATSLKFHITTAMTGIVRCQNVKVYYVTPAVSKILVNNVAATRNGNNFSVEVDKDFCGTPDVKIISDVKNQAYGKDFDKSLEGESYSITWGEEVNGVRNATIKFYNNRTQASTYNLKVTRKTSTTNTLKDLVVESAEGYSLTPKFDPNTLEYTISVPYSQRILPNVLVAPTSDYASVEFKHINNLDIKTGSDKDEANSAINVTVTSESGDKRMYVVNFKYDFKDNPLLNDIVVEGYDLGFEPGKYNYTVTLPSEVENLPSISYTKHSDIYNVTMTKKGCETQISGKNELSKYLSYTIVFVKEEAETQSQIDVLEILNATEMSPAFASDVYEYDAKLLHRESPVLLYNKVRDKDSLVISYEKDRIQLDLHSYVSGEAAKSYVVNINEVLSDNALLKTILVNGSEIANFDAQIEEYEISTMVGAGVDIEPVLAEEGQTMDITFNEDTQAYTIVVTSSDKQATKTYTLKIVKPISDNAQLSGIWINDELIDGFNAGVYEYDYVIPYTNSTIPQPKLQEPSMPNIKAVGADNGQTISIENNGINGKSYITVVAESGSTSTYTIDFEPQKSTYAYLHNIYKNNKVITEFYPSLGEYSFDVPVTTQRPVISFEAGDAFQNFEEVEGENQHIIVVTAQSGDTFTYTINFNRTYTKNALLNGITLDGELLKGFAPSKFEYDVELPVGTQILPMIGVINGAEGQTTEIVTNGVNADAIITVVADDNETVQTYTIHFTVDKSQVNTLLDIQLDGVSIQGFKPDTYEYTYLMPVGSRTWPLVSWTSGDAYQKVKITENILDTWHKDVTILVMPEDDTIESNTYNIHIEVEKSAIDTLKDIQLNNVSLENFDATVLEYHVALPIGTKQYPTVSYTKGDKYQDANIDIKDNMVYINVVAENGSKRIYTIEFEILHSSNVSLSSISVDYELLPNFTPEVLEYNYVLPFGTTEMPVVTYEQGDKWQDVSVTEGGINGDYIITVKAEDNITTQNYVIHFSVALSNNALLNGILVDNKTIDNFYSEVSNYTYTLPYGVQTIPTVEVVKVEGQTVEIQDATSVNEVTTITVTAEDGVTKQIYTISWVNAESSNSKLQMIYLDGVPMKDFDSNQNDYNIALPFGTVEMPVVTWTKGDADQTVNIEWNNNVAIVYVVAQDGTQGEYILVFNIEKSAENRLKDLSIRGVTLEGFNPDVVEYSIVYPAGTPIEEVATLEDITYQLFNDREQVNFLKNDIVLMVQVTAENGNVRTYVIAQRIALSSNTKLESIMIDGVELSGFDPEQLEYIYMLPYGSSAVPTDITYVAQEDGQEVIVSRNQLGEPTRIFVTAEDGSKAVYKIQFIVDEHDPSSEPTAENVCVTSLEDGTWKFTTNSNNITLYIATLDGKVKVSQLLPLVDVNVIDISSPEAEGFIYRGAPGEIVVYNFVHNLKTRVNSGKIKVQKY